MLHRSFKPVKCKTSLKLASSRIKLLKNRKDVQVKQMRRELAQLLESGQEQTARIRVEHVIREEKMKSAYDLLELYCELIAARMQIIESQKNCPIDLKEAIASVIFASPRCSDVTELQDVRKHFTAKYGKEFVSAAVELRPDSGVSRMIVEKLSAKTPDGHEKIKILKEIAEEHNVKWDSKSLEQIELKPPQDLLNGPNTFEKAKIIQTDPPPVQTAAPTTSQSPQIFAGAGHYQQTSFKQPYSETDIVSSPRVKNQNVEFENAVAAAKAAAESAEIACRAAKEAAELARQAKLSRQSSPEQKKSSMLIDSRNEAIRKEDGKEFSNVKNPGHHSLRVKDEEGSNRAGEDKFARPNRSDSLRSKTSADEKYQNDQYSQQNSLVDNHPVKEENNTLYQKQQSSFIEERIVKQASSVSLHSKINNYGDDDDQRRFNHPDVRFHVEPAKSPSNDKGEFSDKASVVFDDFGSDDDNNVFGKKPFVNISGNKPSSSPSQPDKRLPVTFDDFGSDDDNNVFDKKPFVNISGNKPSSSPSQPDRRLPATFDDFGSDDDNNVFDKKPFVNISGNKPSSPPSQPDKLLPVTFDDSDGPSSDSEDEGDKYPLNASNKFNPQPSKNVYIQDPEPVLTKKDSSKKNIYYSNDKASVGVNSSFDDAEALNEFGAWYDKELNFDDEPADPSQSEKTTKETTISKSDEDLPEELSLDYGNLRGGFKHQKPRPPPYTKKASTIQVKPYLPKPDSDSDDSNAAPPRRQSPNNKKESVKVSNGKEVNSRTTFNSDYSESEEDSSSKVSSKVDGVGTTLSRRTKLTPKSDGMSERISSRTELSPTIERVDNSESLRTSYSPKPRQEKPVSLRQRTEPAPSKSLDEEILGYSEADSGKTSSTTYYDPAPQRRKPTSLRRKTESEAFVEEKPMNSETRSDRISSKTLTHQRTEPVQSSYTTMAEEKPKKPEAREDIISSRTSNDPSPQREKPTLSHHRTELGQSSSKIMSEENPEKSETRPDRVSSRTSNDPKPRREKPTITPQRTEPDQSSYKTKSKEKPEKFETSDPKPYQQKPTSLRQRPEPDQSSYKTIPVEKPEKFETIDPKPYQQKPTSLRQRPEPNPPRKDSSKLSTPAIEQPTSSLMKEKEAEEKSEIPKTSTGEGLSSESSIKRASHVHPKLPDYDDIAARLQALRVNRG